MLSVSLTLKASHHCRGADHSAYPYPTDQRALFKRYKPLFFLLKGKRWFLRPHPLTQLTVANGSAIHNVFDTPRGVVTSLGFGPPGAAARFRLSSEVPGCVEHGLVYHAVLGSAPAAPTSVARQVDGAAVVELTLGPDGEAMLAIPKACYE